MNEIDANLVINELRKLLADAQFQLAIARAENAQLVAAKDEVT